MKVNQFLFSKMMAMFREGNVSAMEVADELGFHRITVQQYVKALREVEPRILRVCGWGKDTRGRVCIKLYDMKPGPDVPKPPKKPALEASRQYRERRRMRALEILPKQRDEKVSQ